MHMSMYIETQNKAIAINFRRVKILCLSSYSFHHQRLDFSFFVYLYCNLEADGRIYYGLYKNRNQIGWHFYFFRDIMQRETTIIGLFSLAELLHQLIFFFFLFFSAGEKKKKKMNWCKSSAKKRPYISLILCYSYCCSCRCCLNIVSRA